MVMGDRKPAEAEAAGEPQPQGPAWTGAAAPDGDWRGPYGYGHRAYRPDPQARYSFDPGPPRTLPASVAEPEPEMLWKRPLR